MFRKNSWIVALLLVLSLSVFFGCIEVIEEEDTDTYTYVDIGTEYNTWGGQAYQRGWSTDGASWNDPDHTVKNLGLDLEDFKNARYLELELNVTTAGSGDVIWGNESNGWNQTAGAIATGASGTVKIDITKLVNYTNYVKSASQIRIIIQYNQAGQGNVEGLIKSAKLAIPDTPLPPPVDYSKIPVTAAYQIPSITPSTGYYEFNMDLNKARFGDLGTSNSEAMAGSAIEANRIKISYKEGNQTVMFEFTDAEKVFIRSAARAAKPITITLDGECAPAANSFRWTISRAGTSGWNVAGQMIGGNANAFDTIKTGNFTSYSADANDIIGINFQARNSGGNGDALADSYELTINKITVKVIKETVISDFAFSTNIAPVATGKAVYDLTGAEITGKATWSPAIDASDFYWKGLFKPGIVYVASIAVEPKPHFIYDKDQKVFQFTVPGAEYTEYDIATGVLKAVFPMTASLGQVSGTFDFTTVSNPPLAGEAVTIVYTAGTGVPASITGWQWQFLDNGEWTDVAGTTATYTPLAAGNYRVRAAATGYLPAYAYIFITAKDLVGSVSITQAPATPVDGVLPILTAVYVGTDSGEAGAVTCTWFLDDKAIAGATAMTFQTLQGGSYTVQYNKVGYNSIVSATALTVKKTNETKVTIKVGGVDQEVTVKTGPDNNLGSIGTDAYVWAAGAANNNYGNQTPRFLVDLGDGKKLSDFSKISFKMIGLAGDVGYKNVAVRAYAVPDGDSIKEPSNWIQADPSAANSILFKTNGLTNANTEVVYTDEAITTANLIVGVANDNFNAPTMDSSSASTSRYVWIVINMQGNAATFRISEIEFNE